MQGKDARRKGGDRGWRRISVSRDTLKICAVAHIGYSLAFLAFSDFGKDSLHRSSYICIYKKPKPKSNLGTFCWYHNETTQL